MTANVLRPLSTVHTHINTSFHQKKLTAGKFPGKWLHLLALAVMLPAVALLQGCSATSGLGASTASKATTGPSIQPSSANIQVWQSFQFAVSNNTADTPCTWNSSQPSVLANVGDGQFQGAKTGTATVSVTCGTASATASVTVTTQAASGPITITKGGVYSGDWNSTDPSTPAVTVQTDEPVTIQDSVITSRGALIRITGKTAGANVTIENVTGTALDPQVSGTERGAFVLASGVASLVVKNCSMTGTSFGVEVIGSEPSTLQILNNSATNLEDRASDGQGGFLTSRPSLGHFIILNGVSAPSGAEIAWNKVVQTMGESSTEDVINLYNSQGSAAHPIWVHDNYMEGSSSPVSKTGYTGTALITDGNGAQPAAYVLFEANQIVATAGSGIGIAAGHDITARANRVVSCGVDAAGSWYAWGASAVGIWNYYGSSEFYNNTITTTSGGMVGPGSGRTPKAFDEWSHGSDATTNGDSIAGDDFTDPCLTSSGINLQAEQNERTYWTQKIAAADEVIGDQHLN